MRSEFIALCRHVGGRLPTIVAALDHDVRHHLAAALRTQHDRHLRHRRMPGQGHFNFLELDAVATHLHLKIDPTEELDLAVRQPASSLA